MKNLFTRVTDWAQGATGRAGDQALGWWESQSSKVKMWVVIGIVLFFVLLIASLFTFAAIQRASSNDEQNSDPAAEAPANDSQDTGEAPAGPGSDFENAPDDRSDLPDEAAMEDAQTAAEDAILEWVKQDHTESKKDRQARLEEVFTSDSVVPSWEIPFPPEDGEEWIDASGTIVSTSSRSTAPKRIVFTTTVDVTRLVQYYDGETTHEERSEFTFNIAMLRQGEGWAADTINQAE